MNLICILTYLVAVALLVCADKDDKASAVTYHEVQLEPVGEISPKLKIGNRSEVIPKAVPRRPGFGVSRIVRGDIAAPEKYPYHVGIIVGLGNGWYAFCGGTLIGNEWIVTAAHCTSGAQTIEVRLGSVNFDTPLRVSWGYQNHIHPNYGKKNGDIALVKIQWVDYNVNMAPAALPPLNGYQNPYTGARVVATGWGATDDHGGKGNLLKYSVMSIIEPQECANVYGPNGKDPAIMCTSTKNTGATCSGDSGGPLVLENTRLLLGVTTFGAAGNCAGGLPDGFSRITFYLSWIKDVTGISW
ncbi:serine protease 3-like [Eupeodes corollae]|uniref:serine protease 3-like n=1 Tax=Eupeodes corollae TaxID=290404 RepID=UPI002493BD2A|nr:serine protease 3-like [Eupeodes corollae]